jgi:hypothetical protein
VAFIECWMFAFKHEKNFIWKENFYLLTFDFKLLVMI